MIVAMLAVGTGCAGSDEGTSSNELAFHGELPVLPSFTYDTGLLPASSPVQLRLAFSAGGGLTADAKAIAGGEGDALAVVGVAGSGLYKVDAHIKLEGQLKVNVSGLTYDGPIPGIENVDIAFGGETAFDPFLGTAKITAALPEIKLPPIPLPGGLPGTLQLTVAAGSVLNTELSGACGALDDHSISFLGKTSTSADLVISSQVILQVPIVGDKTFDIPSFTVNVPAFAADMDFGVQEFAGGGAAPAGMPFATKAMCGGGDGGGGDGGGDGGGGSGTCAVGTTSYTPSWHPPTGRGQDACTATALAQFETACMSDTATKETCAAFRTANASCTQCLITPSTSPGYGPIVSYPTMGMLNVPGCVALVAPAQLTCAKQIQAAYDCLDKACTGCADSTADDIDACYAEAASGVCAAAYAPVDSCFQTIETTPAAAMCFDSAYTSRLFCGPPQ